MFTTLVLTLSLAALVPAELVLFSRSGTSSPQRVRTADYFASNYGPYSMENKPAILMDRIGPDCTLLLPSLNDTLEAIVFVDAADAFRAPQYCHDFRRLADSVASAWKAATSSPLPALVMLNSHPKRRGYTGGPYLYYTAETVFGTDGPPPFPTVFMQPADSYKVWSILQQSTHKMQVSLTQEDGPWNRMYRSIPYRIARWSMFVLAVVLLVYACSRLVVLIRQGRFVLTHPFMLLYLACLLCIPPELIALRLTPKSVQIFTINAFVVAISVVSMLTIFYKWLQRLRECDIHIIAAKFICIVQIAIVFCLAVVPIYILPMFVRKSGTVAQTLDTTYALLINAHGILLFTCGVLFAVAAIQFYLHLDELQSSARELLWRLTILNVMSSMVFFGEGIGLLARNMAYFNVDSPYIVLIHIIMLYSRHIVRLAIVLVLVPIDLIAQK